MFSRKHPFLVAVLILLSPCAYSQQASLTQSTYIAPEYYTVEIDHIWVLYTADELPSGGSFKNEEEGKHLATTAAEMLTAERGYSSEIVRPKKTEFVTTLSDLTSSDTNWMSALQNEERRFVFLSAVQDVQYLGTIQSVTVSGYLVDTYERRYLWRGETSISQEAKDDMLSPSELERVLKQAGLDLAGAIAHNNWRVRAFDPLSGPAQSPIENSTPIQEAPAPLVVVEPVRIEEAVPIQEGVVVVREPAPLESIVFIEEPSPMEEVVLPEVESAPLEDVVFIEEPAPMEEVVLPAVEPAPLEVVIPIEEPTPVETVIPVEAPPLIEAPEPVIETVEVIEEPEPVIAEEPEPESPEQRRQRLRAELKDRMNKLKEN